MTLSKTVAQTIDESANLNTLYAYLDGLDDQTLHQLSILAEAGIRFENIKWVTKRRDVRPRTEAIQYLASTEGLGNRLTNGMTIAKALGVDLDRPFSA